MRGSGNANNRGYRISCGSVNTGRKIMTAHCEDMVEFTAGSDGLENFAAKATGALQNVQTLLGDLYANRKDPSKLAAIVESTDFQSTMFHCCSALELGKIYEF